MIFNIEVGMKNVTASLDSSLPADVTVTAGGEATFKVVVTDEGIPKEHTFQWYVNDAAIEGATEDTYTRDTSGDKGQFSVWCEVTNKAGTTTSRRATLTVKKVPSLNSSYPKNVSKNVTENATFEVKISESGYPDAYTYQWYKDGKAVSGATKSSYTLSQTTEGTATVYCEVTNGAGTVKTRTATYTANRIYLYNKGDKCSAVTGGWVAARSSSSADGYINGLTFGDDYMSVISKNNEYSGGCGSSWAINLSKHTRLNVLANTDGSSWFGVSSQLSGFDTHTKATKSLTGYTTTSLDISSVDSGHIVFYVSGSGASRATKVHSVWLG